MKAFKEAARILEHAFISPEDVQRLTNFPVYNRAQISHLAKTVPGSEVLTKLDHHGCILVPSPSVPLSLRILRQSALSKYFYQSIAPWYLESDEVFQDNEALEPATWYALRRSKVMAARMQSFETQCRTLATLGLAPAPVVLINYSAFMYLEVHGSAVLFKDDELRTSSLASNGMNVSVGPFTKLGLPIMRASQSERRTRLNIAAQYVLAGE